MENDDVTPPVLLRQLIQSHKHVTNHDRKRGRKKIRYKNDSCIRVTPGRLPSHQQRNVTTVKVVMRRSPDSLVFLIQWTSKVGSTHLKFEELKVNALLINEKCSSAKMQMSIQLYEGLIRKKIRFKI